MNDDERTYKKMTDEELTQVARSKLVLVARLMEELNRRGWEARCNCHAVGDQNGPWKSWVSVTKEVKL